MSNPLLKDLQELVRNHIISAETAENITAYYASREQAPSSRLTTILAILGALLLGAGIVLVIAHNWDMLGRPLRTIIAFTPLVITQALSAYAFLKKKNNAGWTESVSILLFFAVPTCIALISQIYQVNGSLSSFLITWIVLTIPLVYLMNSSVVSLLMIVLATWHGVMTGYFGEKGLMGDIPVEYVLIILALLPHYLKLLREEPSSNFFHWYNWFAAISFLVMLGAFSQNGYDRYNWTAVAYVSLGGLFYLLGRTDKMARQRWFANPYLLLGNMTVIPLLLIWTFIDVWPAKYFLDVKTAPAYQNILIWLTVLLLVISAVLWIRQPSEQKFKFPDIMGLTPFVFAAGVLFLSKEAAFGILLFNIWTLAVGIYYTRRGAVHDHLGILNYGLIIIALLAVMRFFDDYIPFIWRGLMFIGAGAGFFIANSMILKRRKRNSEKARAQSVD